MKSLEKEWKGDKCGRADPSLFMFYFIFPINIHGFNQGVIEMRKSSDKI